MSDGYEQQEGQLAVVARPQAPLKLEPFSSEVWEHPRVARQELGFGIATMFAFHRRSSAFYQTLADIAHFLPKEGRQCQEANDLVKHQRCWMYDVGCAVGSVVSTCYQLESNTLKELDAMFQTGQQKLPIALAKANFRVTLKNLQSLGAERELARQKIAELEALATQMVTWQGQEKKMQHAVMDVLSKFGGSAQCQAYLDDLQANQAALTKARDAERAAAQKLSQIAGKQDELQCQSIVYEGIANNEAGRLQTLQTRAKKLDDDAAQRAEEAAKTLNIAYQKRSGWFGQWVTDWVDNRGDCAKWRAERFRDIARKAKEEEGDQGTLAKKANSELADVKGKLTAVKKDMEDALKVLGSAAQATAAAEEALKETQQKVKALRHEHGDLNLCQIAALRDHMQKFPELLGATGVQDHSMFATMKGELKYHENLCARLTEFLALNDEACEHLMLVLRPEIAKAIENSKFFSTELGPLKNKIDEQIAGMEKMAIEHGNIPTPSRAAGSAPVPEARQPLFVSLADEDEEEDVF